MVQRTKINNHNIDIKGIEGKKRDMSFVFVQYRCIKGYYGQYSGRMILEKKIVKIKRPYAGRLMCQKLEMKKNIQDMIGRIDKVQENTRKNTTNE